MPDIKRILSNIKNGLAHEHEEIDPIEADARDRVTTDKYLRSLRRQYRVEQERVEKEQLRNELARIEKDKERKYLWGFKDEQERPGRKPPQKKATYLSKMSLR